MDGFEALTEAMNQCAASAEHFANAVRQAKTQCGHIKRKIKRPVYCEGERLYDGYKRIVRIREGFRK